MLLLRRSIFIVLAAFASGAWAQPVRVEVAPSALSPEGQFEVVDGRPTTLPLIVENQTDTPIQLEESVSASPGWRTELPGTTLELAPRERALRLVTIFAPSDASIERGYVLSYELTDLSGFELETAVALSVPPRSSVEAGRLFLPPLNSTGAPIPAEVTVTNAGNITESIRLVFRTSDDVQVAQDSTTYRLGPGEVRAIPIRLIPSADQRTGRAVAITADVFRADETERTGRIRSTGYLIPESPRRGLVYHTFPVRVEGGVGTYQTTAFTPEDADPGSLYFRASGQGPLREDGSTEFEFEIEPIPYNPTGFGIARDRYFAKLESPQYEALAGDAAYVLSPLISSSFGFGAAGEVRPGPFRARGLVLRDRFDDAFVERNFLGGSVGLDVTDQGEIFASAINVDGLAAGQAYSGGLVFGADNPFGPNRLIAEAGIGVDDEGRESFGGALRASVFRDGYSAALTLLEQGSSFPGLIADRFYGTSSLRFPLGAQFDVRGNTRFSRRGGLSSTQGRPFYSQSARLTGSYRRNLAQLTLQHRANGNTRDVAGYRLLENFAEAETTLRRGRLQLSILGSLGYSITETDLVDLDFVRLGTGAGISAQVGENTRLSLQGSYTQGGAYLLRSDVTPEVYRLRALLATGLFDRLTATASVSASVSELDFTTRSAGVFGRANYLLPWGHSIRLEGNYRAFSSESPSLVDDQALFTSEFETASVLAAYVVPLGIPLHRSRSTGLVRGRVTDAESGAPVFGTAVFLERDGRRVGGDYTDADGGFFLPEVTPGDAELVIDTQTTGLGYVVDGGERQPVRVTGGDIVDVSLSALPGASVDITVAVVDSVRSPVTGNLRIERQGLARIPYEVSRDEETIRGATDGIGRAFVGRLTPGTYRLRLPALPSSLLPITPTDTVLTVLAGEPARVEFLVRRQQRPVRFADTPPLTISVGSGRLEDREPLSLPVTTVRREPSNMSEASPNREANGRVMAGVPPSFETGVSLPRTHLIRIGDTLVRLARLYYGASHTDGWAIIYNENRATIRDPNLIYPGQELLIPVHPETVDINDREP